MLVATLMSLLLVSCSDSRPHAALTSNIETSIKVAIDSVETSSNQYKLRFSAPPETANILFCAKSAQAACSADAHFERAVAEGVRGGLAFFVTTNPVLLTNLLEIHIKGLALDGAQSATSVALVSAAGLPTLPEGQSGKLELTLREIFDQKGTTWCWAYSAFHALNSYFTHLPPSSDESIEQFRSAILSIKSDEEFRAIMRKYRNENQLGSPYQFSPIIKKEKSLSNVMQWDNLQGSRRSVVNQVVANLRLGIPAAYCYGGHCVMIYGFHSDGTKVTKFSIADSVGHRRYTVDYQVVYNEYWALWTLPGDEASTYAARSATGSFTPVFNEAIDPFKEADRQRLR